MPDSDQQTSTVTSDPFLPRKNPSLMNWQHLWRTGLPALLITALVMFVLVMCMRSARQDKAAPTPVNSEQKPQSQTLEPGKSATVPAGSRVTVTLE